jgi:hypothetical protein
MANSNIFAQIARKATSLSPLMEGRTKISMREIIERYPDGVTVTAFDMLGSGADAYPVFIFAEDPTVFAFGGAVMGSIVGAWIQQFGGSVEDASDGLASAGGVRMVFEHSTTKTGRSLTSVRIPE